MIRSSFSGLSPCFRRVYYRGDPLFSNLLSSSVFSTSSSASNQFPPPLQAEGNNKSTALPQPHNTATTTTTTTTTTTPKTTAFHDFLQQTHKILTQPRHFHFYLPRFPSQSPDNNNNKEKSMRRKWIDWTHQIFPFTWSNLAGHTSFLFLAFSYLENDFLHLRLYAFSGICFSIVFQYYREKPLWIPIRWNSLFLFINAIMILVLLKEEDDARNIPNEQKLLFQNVFEKRGMKPVDYLHLIAIAKRIQVKKGEMIIENGKKNGYVYLVKEGSLSVRKVVTVGGMSEKKVIAMIDKHQFIGEMSFLNWSNTFTMMESLQKQQEALQTTSSSTSSPPPPPPPPPLSKEGSDVSPKNAKEENIGREDEALSTEIMEKSLDKFIRLVQGYVTGETNQTDSTANDNGKEKPPLSPSSNMKEMEEGFVVQADVVAEEDCIVFAWKFKDLYQLMTNYPSLGFVFERCLSNDLHQKMAFRSSENHSSSSSSSSSTPSSSSSTEVSLKETIKNKAIEAIQLKESPVHNPHDGDHVHSFIWEEDMRIRYKQILLGGLMDGEINPIEKQILQQFREKYQISLFEHNQLLVDLNWTPEDYERGYKLDNVPSNRKDNNNNDSNSDANSSSKTSKISVQLLESQEQGRNVEEYAKMLKKELENVDENEGGMLKEEVKTQLREQRRKLNITTEIQCQLLLQYGWTFDEYEIGKKNV